MFGNEFDIEGFVVIARPKQVLHIIPMYLSGRVFAARHDGFWAAIAPSDLKFFDDVNVGVILVDNNIHTKVGEGILGADELFAGADADDGVGGGLGKGGERQKEGKSR